MPLGEPTVPNKERTGQSTEARMRRTPPVREVFLVATSRDRVRHATMVDRCEPGASGYYPFGVREPPRLSA